MVEVKVIGICYIDVFIFFGVDLEGVFFLILGYEGVGVVVEIGLGVMLVEVGDYVILLYILECWECDYCFSLKMNLCVFIRDI